MIKHSLKLFLLILLPLNALSKSSDSPDLDKKYENNQTWNKWIVKKKKELKKIRLKEKTINYLDSITFNSRVVELDRKQPEFRLTFDKYFSNIVTKRNKEKIILKYKNNKILLKKIEKTFGVDSKVLVSLWGIETSFGEYTGKFDILRSLASLAYDGRRKNFFSKEFNNALLILDEGHVSRNLFKGSWAGAFGQTQFMPSTFLKYAVDFDGDQKINLFNKGDALASGANYLKNTGWDNKLHWGERVDIEVTDHLKEIAKEKEFKSLIFWKEKGILLKKDYKKNDLLRLVMPDSKNNECYLVSKNFDVILGWNRSNYFALTVFLFSNEVK